MISDIYLKFVSNCGRITGFRLVFSFVYLISDFLAFGMNIFRIDMYPYQIEATWTCCFFIKVISRCRWSHAVMWDNLTTYTRPNLFAEFASLEQQGTSTVSYSQQILRYIWNNFIIYFEISRKFLKNCFAK